MSSLRSDDIVSKLPGWHSVFEHLVQLGVGAILHLGDFKPYHNETDRAEGEEDEARLPAEISLVGVEHVRHGEIEEPREEGIDDEADTQGLGAKLDGRGFCAHDRVNAADTTAVEEKDDAQRDADEPVLVGLVMHNLRCPIAVNVPERTCRAGETSSDANS